MKVLRQYTGNPDLHDYFLKFGAKMGNMEFLQVVLRRCSCYGSMWGSGVPGLTVRRGRLTAQ